MVRPPSSPSTPTSRSRRARAGWSRRTRRASGVCSAASATRVAPTPAAGSSTRVSASTTGSTTSGRRSASDSSRSSDAILAARSEVAARYGELLGAIPGLELPCADDAAHERSWFVYVVALPAGADREAVIRVLDERGVQTARYLPCIHLQPYMRERFGFRPGLCPVAEEAGLADARPPVPCAAPRGRPGVRRRGAARRARASPSRPRSALRGSRCRPPRRSRQCGRPRSRRGSLRPRVVAGASGSGAPRLRRRELRPGRMERAAREARLVWTTASRPRSSRPRARLARRGRPHHRPTLVLLSEARRAAYSPA